MLCLSIALIRIFLCIDLFHVDDEIREKHSTLKISDSYAWFCILFQLFSCCQLLIHPHQFTDTV